MTTKEQEKIENAIEIIDKKAKDIGLDYYDTEFLIAGEELMDQIRAYVLPVRYHHWTFGQEYQKHKTLKKHGLSSTIYECVINSDPAYAFLLEKNNLTEMKVVIAHVLGHVDFFKNNLLYNQVNKRMATECALNAQKISDYYSKYGEEKVEKWIDACMSISKHCELSLNNKKEKKEKQDIDIKDEFDFMFRKENLKKMRDLEEDKPSPIMEKDLLLFLLNNRFSDLDGWQKDVMSIVRDEMRYFIPNIQTKIINEGWSCITGDSLVATDLGFIPIKKIYDNKIKTKLFNQNGYVKYNNPHITEKDKIYKVTLRNGMSISGLSRHKLQTLEKNEQKTKKIEDLDIKDKIICSFNNNIWSQENYKIEMNYQYNKFRQDLKIPQEINYGLSEFIGMFISEGHYGARSIVITSKNFQLLEYLKNIVIENFNIVPNNKQRKYKKEIHKYDLCLHSVEIIDLFQNQMGILNVKPGDKEIPRSILQSKKEVVCGFIRGLYEGDDCVYYNEKSQRSIIYVSKSKKLIEQLSMLLNNLGIETSYSLEKKKGYQDCHKIYINGKENIEKFKNEIGFISKEKNNKLSDIINSYKQNKKALFKHINIKDTEWIISDIFSIEETNDENICYDLTVPKNNVYVANGILNHNTFFHQKILEELDNECDFLKDDREDWYLYYSAMNSSVLSPGSIGRINPYLLGNEIWKNIYEKTEGDEKEKIETMLDIRATHTDALFIKNYLTQEIVENLDLFIFSLLDDAWTVTETTNWTEVRDMLYQQLIDAHIPTIYVVDDDYNNNRELLLMHDYNGDELEYDSAIKTLGYVSQLWKRPVSLRTAAHLTYEIGIDNQNNKRLLKGENLVIYLNHDGKKAQSVLAQEKIKPITETAKDYFDAKWRKNKFESKIKDDLYV
jgi:stage V sporulation protein R